MSDLNAAENGSREDLSLAEQAIDKAKRKPVGRVDGGQEQEPDGAKLKKLAAGLIELHESKKRAAKAFNDAVLKTAKDSGFNAAVVKRLISARCSNDYGLFVARQEQLQIAILEAGE